MKKKFLIFLIFISFYCFCFAQYRDTYWHESKELVTSSKELYKGKTYQGYEELLEPKLILGESSSFSYIFKNDKLISIAYELNYTEKLKNLILEKMATFPYKIESSHKSSYIFGDTILKEIDNSYNLKILATDDIKAYKAGGKSIISVILNEDETEDPKSKLIIASYPNTDIYIYSNVFEGKIVVVYTEHEDEF